MHGNFNFAAATHFSDVEIDWVEGFFAVDHCNRNRCHLYFDMRNFQQTSTAGHSQGVNDILRPYPAMRNSQLSDFDTLEDAFSTLSRLQGLP